MAISREGEVLFRRKWACKGPFPCFLVFQIVLCSFSSCTRPRVAIAQRATKPVSVCAWAQGRRRVGPGVCFPERRRGRECTLLARAFRSKLHMRGEHNNQKKCAIAVIILSKHENPTKLLPQKEMRCVPGEISARNRFPISHSSLRTPYDRATGI